MKFIIDGYNLIGQHPSLALSDADKEDKLVHYINTTSTKLNDRFQVVFDGQSQIFPNRSRYSLGRVAVLYTSYGESADEVIVQGLSRVGQKSGMTVVSSDREIILGAKSNQIPSMNCPDFLNYLTASSKQTAQKPGPSQRDTDYWLGLFGE